LLLDDAEQLRIQPEVRNAEIHNGTPGEKPGLLNRARALFGIRSRL
jgi:hypothetical protein